MEAITIKPELWEEIKLPKANKILCIEIACEKEIDFGVLDKKNLDIFYDATNDRQIDKIEWYEQVSGLKRFDVEIDTSKTYYLILWNAYSKNKTFVSYNWFVKE